MGKLGEGAPQGVWIGKDVTIKELQTIPPQKSKPVTVEVDPMRDILPQGYRFDGATTILSTRSRYAQLGGEFPLQAHEEFSKALTSTATPTTELSFTNHSFSPIVLTEGPVCKLLYKNGPPISGEELTELIKTEKITMGGEEGKDWWIAKDKEGKPVGVGLFLKEEEEWIPPSTEPVLPTGETTLTFREEMQKHLQPIQSEDKPEVRIGETRGSLFTTEDYIALIEQKTQAQTPAQDIYIANAQHINSPALYGGYPANPWPIRTEILSTEEELNAAKNKLPKKAIIATFYPVLNQQLNEPKNV